VGVGSIRSFQEKAGAFGSLDSIISEVSARGD
jgi:hypothetical protein